MSCQATLDEILKQRILLLDGAMGTMIQSYRFSEQDFRGARFKNHARDLQGNNDLLVLSRPHVIEEIHQAYLDAGADILETNTFNSTAISQADYGTEALVYELNREAARLAQRLTEKMSRATPDKPRFVAGILGPTRRPASRGWRPRRWRATPRSLRCGNRDRSHPVKWRRYGWWARVSRPRTAACRG